MSIECPADALLFVIGMSDGGRNPFLFARLLSVGLLKTSLPSFSGDDLFGEANDLAGEADGVLVIGPSVEDFLKTR